MISKPDFLTGEVLPFEDISPFIFYHGLASQIHPLYLQPFTPDMITEYFEGWKKNDLGYYTTYTNNSYMLSVWHNDYKLSTLDHTLTTDRIQTLAQFISNCNQAGIKLTWRNK